MRTGVRTFPGGFMSGSDLRIIDVRTDLWREFWFVSKESGGVYTLDCYASEMDALAETHKLAAATHAASVGGNSIAVPMVIEAGAPFDATPMTVTLHAQGTWALARIAWTHNVTGLLLRRITALIDEYRQVNEVLYGVSIQVGHQTPMANMPAVGVSSGAVSLEGQVQQFEEEAVQIELHAWVSRLENDDAYLDAVSFGSALIAIAEEQRTWGGLAADTTVMPPAQIGIETPDGGGLVYHALVVLRVRFPDFTATRGGTSDEYGTGGKYAAAL